MAYAPGITYTGDRSLFSGLQSGNEMMAKYLSKYMEDRSEGRGLEMAISGAYNLHKDDPAFVAQYHDDFNRVGQMSNAQRKAFAGTLAGYAANEHAKLLASNMAHDNRIQDQADQRAADAAALANRTRLAVQGFTGALGTMPDVQPGVLPLATLAQMNSASGKAGRALQMFPGAGTPEVAGHMLTALAGEDRLNAPEYQSKPQQVTLANGQRVNLVGTSRGQLQVIPEETPPMSPNAIPVTDPDGNIHGFGLFDPKARKIQMLPQTPEITATMPADANNILGPQIHGTLSQLARAGHPIAGFPAVGVRQPGTQPGAAPAARAVAGSAAAGNALPDIDVARRLALQHISNGVPATAIRDRFRKLYGEDLGSGVYGMDLYPGTSQGDNGE